MIKLFELASMVTTYTEKTVHLAAADDVFGVVFFHMLSCIESGIELCPENFRTIFYTCEKLFVCYYTYFEISLFEQNLTVFRLRSTNKLRQVNLICLN